MEDESGFKAKMVNPWTILSVAVMAMFSGGVSIYGLTREDIRTEMMQAIREERLSRHDESKAAFVHRMDQSHEACMLSAPDLNSDTPIWAKHMVKNTHYMRCDMRSVMEMQMRMLD